LALACAYIIFNKIVEKRKGNNKNDTEAEIIRLMSESGSEEGSIDESEMEMINNIFEFDNQTAEEIATHRVDIVALPSDAGYDEILDTALTERYSRMPVFSESIDNIIGILYVKDFFHAVITQGKDKVKLADLIRKPYFVPTSKKTDELFEAMRKSKSHMAVVVDEYGGTSGIVTMEDLIEEIMGDISDEYDEEEKLEIEEIGGGAFLLDGTTELEKVAEFFEIELPTDDYDTIGGFVIGELGRIPGEEEQPEIEFSGVIFKVKSVSDNRIIDVIAAKINDGKE